MSHERRMKILEEIAGLEAEYQKLPDDSLKNILVQDDQLEVRVGVDGVWLGFRASTGRSAVFQPTTLWKDDMIIGRTALDWAADMWSKANQIRIGKEKSPC